jgi:membrane-bound ClpP family serine protease
MNWLLMAGMIVVGLMLVAVDFYLPGFVLASVGGLLMLGATALCATTYGLMPAMALFMAEAVLTAVVAYAAIHYFPQTAVGKQMILAKTQTGERAQSAHDPDLVGRTGVAHSVLRPSGVAIIDGKRLDVVAESGMIERGSPIQIVSVEDNRLVVRKT